MGIGEVTSVVEVEATRSEEGEMPGRNVSSTERISHSQTEIKSACRNNI